MSEQLGCVPYESVYLSREGKWLRVPMQDGAARIHHIDKYAQRAPGSRDQPYVLRAGHTYTVDADTAESLRTSGFGRWLVDAPPPNVTVEEHATPRFMTAAEAKVEALQTQMAEANARNDALAKELAEVWEALGQRKK